MNTRITEKPCAQCGTSYSIHRQTGACDKCRALLWEHEEHYCTREETCDLIERLTAERDRAAADAARLLETVQGIANALDYDDVPEARALARGVLGAK